MASEPRKQGDGRDESPGRDRNTAGAQAASGETSSRTGEDWDRHPLDESFVREARVNEPAARTRMLRERWRRRPPEPQPWRSDEPPAGGFLSRARREQRRRRRRGKER